MKRYLLFVVWVCLCGNIWAQLLQDRIADYVCSSSLLKTSEVGVAVYDLTSDTLIYGYQDKKLYRPASIEKIITSVTALAQLGIDYTFATRVAYTGTILADSTLQGDLYVIGGFDPEFMEEDLLALVDSVYRAGIRRIDGRLIGDVSMKDSVYWGEGWSWDDTPEAFQPYLSPLMLNRGCVDVTIEPGNPGQAGRIEIAPESDCYEVDNRSLTRVPSAGGLQITRNWLANENRILVSGNVSSRQAATLNVYNPQRFFVQTLGYRLRQKGIAVSADSIGFAETPAEACMLGVRKRPLEAVLKRALKESDNLAAESMFYHLGLHGSRKSKGIGSREAQKAISRFMQDSIGCSPKNYKIVDGSGVSLYNYVSPDLLLAYLKYAYHRPEVYHPLYEGLPIAGIDGTLKYRMGRTQAFRRVRAKTGTVTGVCSLAGYAFGHGGHVYAFVIINQNVLKARQARNFQDKVCEILVAG